MDHKAIFKFCKDQGCCDACAVRYLGVRNPSAYENLKKHIEKYQDTAESSTTSTLSTTDNKDTATPDSHSVIDNEGSKGTEENDSIEDGNSNMKQNGSSNIDDSSNMESRGKVECASKRRRVEACGSCLGVLQEETWPECNEMVKEVLDKKGYDCQSFACALSAPISTLLRERVLTLRIQDAFPEYETSSVTPLKEAWKWVYGTALSKYIARSLDSGAVCPLLVTVTLEYPGEAAELELLKTISPELFESRSKQKRRFTVQFTRRSAEQALEGPVERIRTAGEQLSPAMRARCVSVSCTRDPIYIGGRYVKLSRSLPQTPWLVAGQRMMESSVQEVIFGPLAEVLGIPAEETEHRLKFMSAGREDVDVRCLGDGRPFAIEVCDPRRSPSAAQLRAACDVIAHSGTVRVGGLCLVSKEELTVLKQGEETKCKTYEALCIKLTHSKRDTDKTPSDPVTVTPADLSALSLPSASPPLLISQRTPIRVLHRRPLLTRRREIISMEASAVEGHPQLFVLRVVTSAGTYVKEWAHGELGRTSPALADVLHARTDILALDVAAVHLDWPRGR